VGKKKKSNSILDTACSKNIKTAQRTLLQSYFQHWYYQDTWKQNPRTQLFLCMNSM